MLMESYFETINNKQTIVCHSELLRILKQFTGREPYKQSAFRVLDVNTSRPNKQQVWCAFGLSEVGE